MPRRIAVVGAGAPGLSSALRILQMFPDVDVTVIGEKFQQDTTSAGAAGIISPIIGQFMDNPIDKVRQWVNDGFSRYISLAEGPESQAAGVMFVSGYMLMKESIKSIEVTPFLKNTVRTLTQEELSKFSNDYKSGFFFTTLMVECKYYLPWLMKRIAELGGHFIQRKIRDFAELADEFDIVVNCAGLGNRELLNDMTVRAMRGQLVRMKAPWIKHFVYNKTDNYHILVGRDNVVVGGTRQLDNYNTTVDLGDTDRILERVGRLVPTLKDATIEAQWVGLRPVRPTVRIERDRLPLRNGKQLVIIHNYGHGEKGVNLSWGTAGETAKLVGDELRSSKL